jgi:hypothetical protein
MVRTFQVFFVAVALVFQPAFVLASGWNFVDNFQSHWDQISEYNENDGTSLNTWGVAIEGLNTTCLSNCIRNSSGQCNTLPPGLRVGCFITVNLGCTFACTSP